MGFGFDHKGIPQYMPKQPQAAAPKASKYGMFNMDGTPATDQMNAIARRRAAQESAGVAQFQDVSDRAAYEQSKRQHELAMMDMERRAAEWQLGQVMKPQDQAPQQPDIRKLIEEQRSQMDQQDRMRDVAKMLANEQRGRDVLASGEEWRWDGNKIVPLTDEYRQSQKAAGRKQAAERDRQAVAQQNREAAAGNARSTAVGGSGRRIGPVTGVDDMGNRMTPGTAQPIPPKDNGTPYQYGSDSDKEAMYWGLIEQGYSPAEARKVVEERFSNRPRGTAKPSVKQPEPAWLRQRPVENPFSPNRPPPTTERTGSVAPPQAEVLAARKNSS
jgi:hypothetical protein